MHSIFAVLVFGLASFALGNFWAFIEYEIDWVYFKFYNESNPSCDTVLATHKYEVYDDVSSAIGVRVDGDNWDPNQLEIHTKLAHFTIYKDRGYKIYDTNNVEHGFCQHVNSVQFVCVGQGESGIGEVSVLHCNSDYYVITSEVFAG